MTQHTHHAEHLPQSGTGFAVCGRGATQRIENGRAVGEWHACALCVTPATESRPDPALVLAQRIYTYKKEGEAWTTAVDRYAQDVLYRHPRTVHRWLAGESPVPLAVANFLKIEVGDPDNYRARVEHSKEVRP